MGKLWRTAPFLIIILLATGLTVPALTLGITTPLAPAAQDPAKVGRWDPVLIEGEVPAVSMAVLPDGRVLYWSGVEAAHDHDEDMTFFLSHPHDADSRVIDLSGARPVVIIPHNRTGGAADLFCAGHAILPDGRERTFYAMPYQRYFIWGATAGMLRNLYHFLRA